MLAKRVDAVKRRETTSIDSAPYLDQDILACYVRGLLMANQEGLDEKQIPVEWHIPEQIVSRYASNMVVQNTGQEFIISFFEIFPPLLFGTPADLAKLDQLESVRAECIARIIVSKDRMPKFIEALQTNFERGTEKAAKQQEE